MHTPIASPPLTRRAFCAAVAGAAFVRNGMAAETAAGAPAHSGPSSDGVVVRQYEPPNYEMPFDQLGERVTPTHQHYLRTHFGVPQVDASKWRLRVEGAVERPLELTLDEVRRLAGRKHAATLECAGNGRVFLKPKADGVLWGQGAVSTAEWEGPNLTTLLERAGVQEGAVEVIFEGADRGEIHGKSPGPIHFARSLPMEAARRPEVLLAHRMNGAELPARHGYPLRLVVPGWYGMASIKWVQRIIVSKRPFTGYFQSLDYSVFEEREGLPMLRPITELQVKAQIARPAWMERVASGKPYRVFGAAWTGEGQVNKVEISVDGGQRWEAARLLDDPADYVWRRWEYEWTPARSGRVQLMARASDDRGRTQAMQHDPNRRNYMISHVVPIDVLVA